MPHSTVSVVIPCYNGASYLRSTLESALGQTHSPLEIIVIDDGSTDNSAAIAESFGCPVRVIRQSNQGESVARNRGIDEARGDWIAFLDADDKWAPAKLSRQLAVATDETIGVGTGSHYRFDNANELERLFIPPPPSSWVEFGVSFGCPCQISSLLVRRSIKTRFPAWTKYAEDCLFAFDLVNEGSIAIVNDPLTIYFSHAGGQSRRKLIQFDWYKSIETWLQANKGRFEQEQFRHLRLKVGMRLVEACEIAYTARNWDSYEMMTRHLSEESDLPELLAAVRRRRVPKFVYTVYDSAWPLTAGIRRLRGVKKITKFRAS